MNGETAIAMPVPAAEAVTGPWRARLDPASVEAGVPAHITLLYPFRPAAAIDEVEMERLAAFFAARSAIDVTFAGLCGFRGVLYLAPEPTGPLDALIRDLAACYPDTPPYAGEIPDPIPHLTVSVDDSPETVEYIARATVDACTRGALPIRTRLDSVALMECDEDDRWRIIATFPLAPPR